MNKLLWLREETRPTERRTPLVPDDVAKLADEGVRVVVERSQRRVFSDDDYAAAGCELAAPGSWKDAPGDAVVLGIKELPDAPADLTHRHIFFAHAYKGQEGADDLLRRFVRGSGQLLDLEYLTDDDGRRLAAFGYWAGYVGAALGVLELAGKLPAPLQATSRESLDTALRAAGQELAERDVTALVIGARGRSGRGALEALGVAGVRATPWDLEETATLDREALLGHDLLVNCVLATTPIPPFVRAEDVADPRRRLSVIADVTCDVHSDINVLPINRDITTWSQPVRDVGAAEKPLRVIAIDNLPSLLPLQASESFSAELSAVLAGLWEDAPEWRRDADLFKTAAASLERAGAEASGVGQASDEPGAGFEDLLAFNNERYAISAPHGFDGVAHAGVLMVTCMDSRLEPLEMIGLRIGEAKILRTPGGHVTPDALSGCVLGVHLLNVDRILVVEHTRCAAAANDDAGVRRAIWEKSGVDTGDFAFGADPNQEERLTADVKLLREHPLIAGRARVGGFILDVDTGKLRAVV
ncbi:carbonic anhydrase [Nigerium massiliense]|uniref:carbonic anhydrase n=1 Tax=Nigerium massiliense TaxID=1522317 RepID=UPI000907BE9E|nr:carbonic anhydrase [Nigerium massiliense]